MIDKRILKGPAKDTSSDISNPGMVNDGRLEREWIAEVTILLPLPETDCWEIWTMGLSQQAISQELIILTSSSETRRKKKEISIGGEKYSKGKNHGKCGHKRKALLKYEYWGKKKRYV